MSSSTPPLDFIRAHITNVTAVEPERITPASRFVDFGLDSIKAMDLVVELEAEYGIEIPDRVITDLATLQELADYVAREQGRA